MEKQHQHQKMQHTMTWEQQCKTTERERRCSVATYDKATTTLKGAAHANGGATDGSDGVRTAE